MLGQLIFQEESETDRGALNRCLHGLHLQTFSSDALASQNFLSEATLSEMRLSKYEIAFGNGVDPFRLKVLCDMLLAATRLFDEELLRENHGVLESLPPYCSACDVFGHTAENCRHYRGNSRTEESFVPQAHMSGRFKLEKLGRIAAEPFLRVIDVNGKRWELQFATGSNFNCLIDTVRSSLGLPFSHALLDSVRNALAKEFPASRGAYRVRSTHDNPNYLEFLEHTRAVARLLLQKAGAQDQRYDHFQFVCVDLDREKFSVLDGVGAAQQEILFVRENGNHFIPVRPCATPMQLLLPWDTDVAAIEAKRRRAEERRRREAEAAELERTRRQKL